MALFAADQLPPDLTHAGARLKSSWLFSYLDDPGSVAVRPWLTTRMPSFGLSETETNTLVRFFAASDSRELFVRDPTEAGPASPATRRDLAVGKVVFGMLQCNSCHTDSDDSLFIDSRELAPDYRLARDRLRPDWIVDWIVDPRAWRPGTRMPTTFLSQDGLSLDGSVADFSFLIGSIHTPIFTVERQRLVRLFGSEAELHAYLSDPVRVATALRDYLWTLGT